MLITNNIRGQVIVSFRKTTRKEVCLFDLRSMILPVNGKNTLSRPLVIALIYFISYNLVGICQILIIIQIKFFGKEIRTKEICLFCTKKVTTHAVLVIAFIIDFTTTLYPSVDLHMLFE